MERPRSIKLTFDDGTDRFGLIHALGAVVLIITIVFYTSLLI